jgi:signal transduction protein with GAF and PtsI domain
MLAPLKRVGKKYKTLIAKMVTNNGTMEANKANLVNMCNVGTILNLPCVLFMLESINALMKFV